jgi:uncharacterized membrane-anchored protein YhcB (DUF1043 family)
MRQINTNLSSTNSQEAVNRAQNSNRAAKAARTARDKRLFILQVLEDWARIFTNSPIGILSALFLFAVIMEIFFSFPMYTDLMSQMTGKGNVVLALVGGFFIVLWGAYVSHLFAKKMSPAMFNYTVYNEMKFSKNAMPQAAAEEEARIATKRDLTKGLILGILLLIVVAAISWQRVWLMGAITGLDYSLTYKLLPVVCVLIEIISGIYVGYLIRRFRESRKAKKLQKEFVREKDLCTYETKMAYEHHQHAATIGEPLHYSKELRDAYYRYEHRSHDEDNYIDPIPEQKTLKVVVADNDGLVQGVHLAGLLSNGEYCNSIMTNEQGEGVLTWDSDAKEVMLVYTDNEQHNGPYRENSTIRIDLKRTKKIKAP